MKRSKKRIKEGNPKIFIFQHIIFILFFIFLSFRGRKYRISISAMRNAKHIKMERKRRYFYEDGLNALLLRHRRVGHRIKIIKAKFDKANDYAEIPHHQSDAEWYSNRQNKVYSTQESSINLKTKKNAFYNNEC